MLHAVTYLDQADTFWLGASSRMLNSGDAGQVHKAMFIQEYFRDPKYVATALALHYYEL